MDPHSHASHKFVFGELEAKHEERHSAVGLGKIETDEATFKAAGARVRNDIHAQPVRSTPPMNPAVPIGWPESAGPEPVAPASTAAEPQSAPAPTVADAAASEGSFRSVGREGPKGPGRA